MLVAGRSSRRCRRGVDGPAATTGWDATSRGAGGASDIISTSSSATATASSDETDSALRMGITRSLVRGVVVVVRVRARFDGVSGGSSASSPYSEADRSEREKATLRFALAPPPLLVREDIRFAAAVALRRADLVGDADHDRREGVLMPEPVSVPVPVLFVGVFDAAAEAATAFFLRISLTVTQMDSFRSAHSSSIIFTSRENILSDTPCLSTNGVYCTVESWTV